MSSILKSLLFAVVFFVAELLGHLMAAQMSGSAFHPNWVLSISLALFVGIALFLYDKKKK